MKFTLGIWHTHSDGLPKPFKNIIAVYRFDRNRPEILFYDNKDKVFIPTQQTDISICMEDFQSWLGRWAYLDDLLETEQKLATAVEYLQKIAWLNTTDDYFPADYHVHLDWCRHVANEALKQIKEEK
jgi:hypothetical protein